MTSAPTRLDLGLLCVMVVLMTLEVRRFAGLRRADAGRGAPSGVRSRAYTYFIAYQWTLVAAVAALWIATRRPWSAILLGTPRPWGFGAGLALACAYASLALMQRRAVLRRPELLAHVRRRAAEFAALAPHTPEERRLWTFACLTAGCCEEVLFRGYLLALVASVTGPIAAVPIAALLFGFYHAYYGPKGILKTAVLGLVLTLIALWSVSLIPGIIIHFLIDLMSGDLAYQAASGRIHRARGRRGMDRATSSPPST